MPDLSADDCATIADQLYNAASSLPEGARSLKTKLRRTGREYREAAKAFGYGEDNAGRPEVRAAGALEPGEYVQRPSAAYMVRRVTETGIEMMVDGRWVWENVMSRTSPVVVVDGMER